MSHIPLWAWIVGYSVEAVALFFGGRKLARWFRSAVGRIARQEIDSHEALYHSGIEGLSR